MISKGKTIYSQTVICPVCKSEDVDDIDIESLEGKFIEGEDGIIERHIGKCRKCNANLSWTRAYVFYGVTDVGVYTD